MATNLHFAALIAEYRTTHAQLTTLEAQIRQAPQCGKPGAGFKARKRAKRQARAMYFVWCDAHDAIMAWITRGNKASKAERNARFARVRSELPFFDPGSNSGLDDNGAQAKYVVESMIGAELAAARGGLIADRSNEQ